MRFRKGGRYRRSEVEGFPTAPIILCTVVLVSVSRSYVTRLFEVDTDFKNVFTLKGELLKEFAIKNNFKIANTFFEKKEQRKFTWVSADRKTKNEIDHTLWKMKIPGKTRYKVEG